MKKNEGIKLSLHNTEQYERSRFIKKNIELNEKPKKVKSPFLNQYNNLKDNSIYTFFTKDSIAALINDREEDETVNELWSKGYLILKLGKAGGTYEEALNRVKGEFSAGMLSRPQFNLFFQFNYLTPEKIDDIVRALLIKHRPDKYLNALLSDKGGALAKLKGNNTGEFILINVKHIFERLDLTDLLTKHLTNGQIDDLLLNDIFTSKVANEVRFDIDEVLFKEFNIKNNIVFTPRKKQYPIINFVAEKYKDISYEDELMLVPTKYFNFIIATRAGKTSAGLYISDIMGTNPIWFNSSKTASASAEKDNKGLFGGKLNLTTISNNGEIKNFNYEKAMGLILKLDKNIPLSIFIDEADDRNFTSGKIEIFKGLKKRILEAGYKIAFIVTMSATRGEKGFAILDSIKEVSANIDTFELTYEECRLLDPENTPARNIWVKAFEQNENLINFSNMLKDDNNGGDKNREHLADILLEHGFGTLTGRNGLEMLEQLNNEDVFLKIVANNKVNTKKFGKVLQNKLGPDYHVISMVGKETTNKNSGKNIIKETVTVFNHDKNKWEELEMSNSNAEKIIDQIKEDNPNKKIVMLSMSMASTSFSIKSIGRSIVIAPDGISALIYQALHRSTTANPGKLEAQMVILTYEDLRFKDVLAFETQKMSREETEEYFTLFNEGSNCVYQLVDKNNVHVSLGDTTKLGGIIDEQFKMMSDKKSFLLTLMDMGLDMGKGVNTLKTDFDDITDKGTEVDGNFNGKEKKESTKSTPKIKANEISQSSWEKMAEAAYIFPVLAQYFYEGTEDIKNMYNNNDIWHRVQLDKDIFKLGMKNSSWKDKFITRWNIVSNFTQNELKNEATEIIKMEGIK